MDREQEIALGDGAQGLIDSQVFMMVLDQIVAEQIDHWRRSKPTDSIARERSWEFVNVVDAIKGRLTSLAATARSHRLQLEAENKRRRIQEEEDERVARQLDIPVEIIRRERERVE